MKSIKARLILEIVICLVQLCFWCGLCFSVFCVFFVDHCLSFCRFIVLGMHRLFSFDLRFLITPLVSSDCSLCVWILFYSYFVLLQQLMAYKLSKPTYQFICTLYLSYNHSIGDARINFI